MRKFMIKALAWAIVIGGLVAVIWPVPNWRMYDANWQPLAMTKAESYCSGWLLGKNGFDNKPNVAMMETCMANSDLDNTVPDIGASVRLACTGLNTFIPEYPIEDCERDVEGYEIWFLKDGGYTWEWNASHPRPQIVQYNLGRAPSRNARNEGGRDSGSREGLGE